MPLNSIQQDALLTAALSAQKNAYAPYSSFLVGAAVRTPSGDVFAGCNVENASYGLAICAERSAIAAMIAAGEQEIEAICVVSAGGAAPCGACRQVISEFGPRCEVILFDASQPASAPQTKRIVRMHDLLPDSFGPSDLT